MRISLPGDPQGDRRPGMPGARIVRRCRARLAANRPDSGFTLVEAIVSISILAIIFMGLSFALIGGVHATSLARQNQQSGDILNKTVEQARSLGYDALAMRTTDLNTGETGRSPSVGSCNCYNPSDDSTSGSGVEALALDAAGSVFPHVSTEVQNNITFTIKRYVTVPSDPEGTYKRFTSVITWYAQGKTHKRTYSTLIAPTKRGLPLPDFKFTVTSDNEQCRNPGSETVYSFNLKNNGARDAWAITASSSVLSWSYYADTNGNNAYDQGVDTALANNPASGGSSTDLIEPTASKTFFAVASVPPSGAVATPYSADVTFTVTSEAQPVYEQSLGTLTSVQSGACGAAPVPSASATPSPTVSATAAPSAPTQPSAPCTSVSGAVSTNAPGGTLVRYYLYNPSQPGNTTAQQNMPIMRDTGTPPSVGSLYGYSTDLDGLAGRALNAPVGSNTSAAYVASWTYQMPANSTMKGDGSVTIYAAPANGLATSRPTFTVYLDKLDSAGNLLSTIDSATFTPPTTGWGCSGYAPFSVAMDGIPNNTTISANQRLRVRVVVTNNVPVRLAYGTGTFPAQLTLPYSNGQG